eukprot:5317049-Ditylum_brightwellii.AAC.1
MVLVGTVIPCLVARPLWEAIEPKYPGLIDIYLLRPWDSILLGVGVIQVCGCLHWKRGNVQCDLLVNIC